jgi:hypothetical protein
LGGKISWWYLSATAFNFSAAAASKTGGGGEICLELKKAFRKRPFY